jgi:hypothetical protein
MPFVPIWKSALGSIRRHPHAIEALRAHERISKGGVKLYQPHKAELLPAQNHFVAPDCR